MTEQNLPSQDSPAPGSQTDLFETDALPAPADLEAAAQSNSDWESVSFPGVIPLEEMTTAPPPRPLPQVAEFSQREAELLQLIQDLNQCNDALLARVDALEQALECSEVALQSEVERAQQNQSTTSAEAQVAIAQQQHQVAQLLSELDIANDAVRRTTIHNETLQVELETNKQRVAQLERECTLLQQRFTEKASALQQAETTCRDLRSRLQRQQHYTLQFKAALEKCLDMSAQRAAAPVVEMPKMAEVTALRPHPLAMPKAQQIRPWSSEAAATAPDHTLDALLRNLKSVGQGPGSPLPSALSTPSFQPPAPPADPEAETQLWQDLERVIETSAPQGDGAPTKAVDPLPAARSEAAEPTFTEPSPWGTPLPAAADPPPEPAEPELSPAASLVAEALERLSSPSLTTRPPGSVSMASPGHNLPPLLNSSGGSPVPISPTPSPLVYPLRPQKKLKSIAAVQLPSFPRQKRAQ